MVRTSVIADVSGRELWLGSGSFPLLNAITVLFIVLIRRQIVLNIHLQSRPKELRQLEPPK